jgi:hypothetical protein
MTAELNGKAVEMTNLNEVYLGEAGTLRITLNASDYLGTALAGSGYIDVLVESDALPVLDVRGMPHGAVSGKSLELPDFTAINYGLDKGEEGYHAFRAVFVNDVLVYSGIGADGISGSLVYEVTQPAGVLTVKYAAGGSSDNLTVSETYLIPIIAGDRIKQFVTAHDPLTGASDNDGVSAVTGLFGTAFTLTEDKTLRLLNPLTADGLITEFGVQASAASFDKLTITLEDYFDSRTVVFLDITMVGVSAYMRVNGTGSLIPIRGSIIDEDNPFYFRFSGFSGQVIDVSGDVVSTISRTASGSHFYGFTGGMVRLSFTVSGIEAGGSGSVVLRTVGNQTFAAVGDDVPLDDFQPPQIAYSRSFGTKIEADPGQTVILPAARAADVLAPYSTVTVTVVNAAGAVYNGMADLSCGEERQLTFTEYGFYYLNYKAVSGNTSRTYTTAVIVGDKVPPELTVLSTVRETAAAGQTIPVPQASAEDNYSETRLFVFMVRPDGKIDVISPGASYTFTQEGKHKLVYYAYDDDHNVSIAEYVITVSGGVQG